ncbi:nucleoside phosphorylase [Desulfurivibrio dismutans]|uniref:nucleoside phosphorylase n=1 Tax=Desulfurivibrio dismutans TaxID=1398908 RepID=UPI0023DB6845|nr:nucleoside phosphorylase [Desulfurivibrio alkaliphilus]MDF1614270.1 nucleoside phosphorylase [Desulfurivibrio alkaliphilus]
MMMSVKPQSGGVVIEPCRGPGEPELAGSGLLLINPAEVRLADATVRKAGWQRHVFFPGTLYTAPAGPGWLAGPAVGAPVAVMALEKLVALGASTVITLGWCGALAPGVEVGDIVLPTTALSEEGTSAHYPLTGGPAAADDDLNRKLVGHLTEADFTVHAGPVWTTDAPYRETWGKVTDYRGRGILAVEMEFAALATVAAFRGVPLASVLLVSDLVREEQAWAPAFRHRDFRRQARRLLALLQDFITLT